MENRFKIKKIVTLLLAVFFSVIGVAQNQQWQVLSSTITFKIKNAGFVVNGSFSGLESSIQFDASKILGNKVEASINANTVNTNNSTRDGHLKKEEYFWVDKFPKINISSISINKVSDGKFKGLFTVAIKGVSKIVPIEFTFTEQNNKAVFLGDLKINRLDFTVGSSSIILSDNVDLSVELNCVKK